MTQRADLQDLLERSLPLWGRLERENLFIKVGTDRSAAQWQGEEPEQAAAYLRAAGASAGAVHLVCRELEKTQLTGPLLLDLARAALLVERQKLAPTEALLRARVRYQGTDGLRGKMALPCEGLSPFAQFADHFEITPALFSILSRAALKTPVLGPTPKRVIVAEDGRDAFGERRFTRAVLDAFATAGLDVIDLGIAPTPLVPFASLKFNIPLGAMVTASHNPSDQNGIKFFSAGKKHLPSPQDFQLSAMAFEVASETVAEKSATTTPKAIDPLPLLLEYLEAGLSEADRTALESVYLLIDVAHGAWAPYARTLLEKLNLTGEVLHAGMTGDNINQDSGAALLEGRHRIAGAIFPYETELLRRLKTCTLENDVPVIGLSLDGDGDRGLITLYDTERDDALILDGDQMGYLLAKLAKEEGRAEGKLFAATVESDTQVFEAVAALGIETVMTPVGDKWLTARPEITDRLLVAEEPSGHLAIPVTFKDAEGNSKTVISGNGLLTGLKGAAALLRLGLSGMAAAEPFPPGLSKTYYAYFVDRDRFRRDSDVWQADLTATGETLASLKIRGYLPATATLEPVYFRDDQDMLYLKLIDGDRTLGAVFARNSGTENKTAAYARGRKEFEIALLAIAGAMHQEHLRWLKDPRLPENQAAATLLGVLADRGRLPLDIARGLLSGTPFETEPKFQALLYALAKEGRVKKTDGELVRMPS